MSSSQTREYDVYDYWDLPEGQRAELIDGELIDMAPPSLTHQRIAGGLYHLFKTEIERNDGSCEALISPIAVNLKADDTTYVEPDVFVVCDPGKLSERGCTGVPDLVVEIVSPTSRRMDYVTKLKLYLEAGVREYWIVDPELARTTVYEPSSRAGSAPLVYPFSVPVSVGIWGGGFAVNFADLVG